MAERIIAVKIRDIWYETLKDLREFIRTAWPDKIDTFERKYSILPILETV